MNRINETSFSHIIYLQPVSIKLTALRCHFRDEIKDLNLHQLIGNHFNSLRINIGGQLIYEIDRFLLINLSPEIKLIDSHCVEIKLPWDKIGFPDIEISRLGFHQVICEINTKISDNEITQINLIDEAIPVEFNGNNKECYYPQFSCQFGEIFNNKLSLNVTFGCCRGFLFTSPTKFPKVTNFELVLNGHRSRVLPNNGFWNQAVQKISSNMYYMPFTVGDDFTNYKRTSSINFNRIDTAYINMTFGETNENDGREIIIYGVERNILRYVSGMADHAYTHDSSHDLPFDSKCVFENNIEEDRLSESEMLEMIVKYLDIQV